MAIKQTAADEKSTVSTVQLAVGAASLFLFIVGLKRTFRVEEARETPPAEDGAAGRRRICGNLTIGKSGRTRREEPSGTAKKDTAAIVRPE